MHEAAIMKNPFYIENLFKIDFKIVTIYVFRLISEILSMQRIIYYPFSLVFVKNRYIYIPISLNKNSVTDLCGNKAE